MHRLGSTHRPGLLAVLVLAAPLISGSAVHSAVLPALGPLAAGITGQADHGSIKGRLVWGGVEVPAPKAAVEQGKAAKDPEVCAKDAPVPNRELMVDPKTKGVAHAIVYLVKPKGSNPSVLKELLAKHPKAELDQIGCEFFPYVQGLHQDQALLIKSSDPVNHNVRYAAFTNAPFNQILGPKGELEIKLVAEKRPILVACDIHPWMKGYLMVFDHPFFAITGPDGSFEIKGVPAGEQNLVIWQEKVGYVNPEKAKGTAVTVKPGDPTDLGAVTLLPSQVK